MNYPWKGVKECHDVLKHVLSGSCYPLLLDLVSLCRVDLSLPLFRLEGRPGPHSCPLRWVDLSLIDFPVEGSPVPHSFPCVG